MGAPKPPKKTREEKEALQSQTDMLNYQRDLMQQQQQQQQLLAPILYKQAGLKPIYGGGVSQDTGLEFKNGEWVQVRPNTVGQPSGEITGFEDLGPTPEEQAYADLLGMQVKGAKYAEALGPLQLRQQGYDVVLDEKGMPTAINLIKGGQAELQAQNQAGQLELNRAFQERTKKAMAGELPLDPGIQRQLDENEVSLRAGLAKNLGPGYETSTPGIQALANFNKRREEVVSAFQHGEISSSAGLGLQGQQVQPGPDPFSTLGAVSGQGQYLNPFASAGSPNSRSAQLLNAVQSPFASREGGGFGTLASQYGQTAASLSQGSAEQAKIAAQLRAQNAAKWGTIGTGTGAVLGGVVGSIVPGIGTAVGAAAGGALGGAIGTYAGS